MAENRIRKGRLTGVALGKTSDDEPAFLVQIEDDEGIVRAVLRNGPVLVEFIKQITGGSVDVAFAVSDDDPSNGTSLVVIGQVNVIEPTDTEEVTSNGSEATDG